MPPRKKKAVEEDEEDDYELEYKFEPKAKKAAAKPKAAPKKKKVKDEDDEDEFIEQEGGPSQKRPKTQKLTEVTDLGDGWTFYPPSLLVKEFAPSTKSTKLAAFDLDGTLLNTKSGARFMVDANDWKPYNDKVYAKLKDYHEKGYKVVVFTNQGGIKNAVQGLQSEKIRGKITAFFSHAKVPAVVLASTLQDENRKPGTGMWKHFCEHYMQGEKPDLSNSFFVGDNWEGGDEGFAEAVGLPFRSEKQEFGEAQEGADTKGVVNGDLVNVFNQLVKMNSDNPFKSGAYKKVATALAEFPKKIINDKAVLKQVAELKGVGKGSMGVIKEYVETGKVAMLDSLPEKAAGPALDNKDREAAMAFM